MGKLLIRNLDDAVIAKLRQRAAANGNSMEEEARRALARSVNHDVAAWLADIDAFRASMPPMPADYTSVDAVAEGRRLRSEELRARHEQAPRKK